MFNQSNGRALALFWRKTSGRKTGTLKVTKTELRILFFFYCVKVKTNMLFLKGN